MTEYVFRKHLRGLVPMNEQAEDALRKIKQDQDVFVKFRRPRNIFHHRKLFALLNLVCNNLDAPVTPEQLLTVIKIRTGHVDVIKTTKGVIEIPKSISFAAMDQTAFEQFWDKAVDFIVVNVLPGVNRQELETEVLEMVA